MRRKLVSKQEISGKIIRCLTLCSSEQCLPCFIDSINILEWISKKIVFIKAFFPFYPQYDSDACSGLITTATLNGFGP